VASPPVVFGPSRGYLLKMVLLLPLLLIQEGCKKARRRAQQLLPKQQTPIVHAESISALPSGWKVDAPGNTDRVRPKARPRLASAND